jgi:hypothetical protein
VVANARHARPKLNRSSSFSIRKAYQRRVKRTGIPVAKRADIAGQLRSVRNLFRSKGRKVIGKSARKQVGWSMRGTIGIGGGREYGRFRTYGEARKVWGKSNMLAPLVRRASLFAGGAYVRRHTGLRSTVIRTRTAKQRQTSRLNLTKARSSRMRRRR